jgi:L,D-transpeptidase ErfK/SrfK
VDRVKRHLLIIGASPRLATLALLGACAVALPAPTSAATAEATPPRVQPTAPKLSLPPQPIAEPPPSAADLIDAVPLRVGFSDHGFPALLSAPEPTPSAPPATAAPAAAAPAAAPSPEPAAGPSPEPPAATAPAPADLQPAGPSPRRLVLDRRRKVLKVLDGERELRRFPVAVGMPGWETPVGRFTVIEKTANPTWEHPASGTLLPPGPANPLGSRWIGFHRDCRGRSGFNGQEHLVVKGCVTAGFHGTPNRASVGRAVSHGCVRLFDEHARELFDLVSLGTPVTVLP